MNKQEEISEKTERILRTLNAEKLGGVILNAQHNFAWLTAGGSNGVDLSRENGSCFLLIRSDGKKFLLASKIEMPRMLLEEISAEDFEPIEFDWEEEKASGNFVIERAASLVEKNSAIASDLFLSAQVRSIENLISRCRYQLTESEIDRYRSLGKDAGEVLDNIAQSIQPEESEKEIACKVRHALARSDIYPVVTLVAADERIVSFRHPVPTENKWKKILMIVVCARRGGLIASLSRIFCLGKIPDELTKRTNSVARVYAKMIEATRPNMVANEIFAITASAYKEEGFEGEEHLHHQGGACGYKTRDWVAHPKNQEVVQINQAFAWNPTITGTKAEETVIVTENGFENLTASKKFPYISVELNEREFLSPDILSL